VKRFAGEFVTAGRSSSGSGATKFHPGTNVRRASDDSLFTVVDGQVRFEHKEQEAIPGERVSDGGGEELGRQRKRAAQKGAAFRIGRRPFVFRYPLSG